MKKTKGTKADISAQRAVVNRKAFGRSKPGVLFPAPETLLHMPADYGEFLTEVKNIVARERIKAVMTGFSPRSLLHMRQFSDAWPDRTIAQRTVAQLPWRSNLVANLKPSLPSVADIEAELSRGVA